MLSDFLKDPHNNYTQALLLIQCTRVHWHAAQNELRIMNTSGWQNTDLTVRLLALFRPQGAAPVLDALSTWMEAGRSDNQTAILRFHYQAATVF